MIKKNKLPTILGLIVLIVGTLFGVILVNSRAIFRLGASGEAMPKNIRVSNISDTSLTISWVTDKESVGFVLWGQNKLVQDSKKSFTHSVALNDLKAETEYSYKINSGGILFDNNGIPWKTKTGSALNVSENSVLISGSVISSTGETIKNALVYANIQGYILSTLTSPTGNYVFQLGATRTQDLKNLLEINEAQTLVEIFVETGTGDVSTAQIFPQSAKPAPPMVLGQTHDFRSLPISTSGGTPNAEVDLPENSEEKSKFAVADNVPVSGPAQSVTLESLDDGEVVTSTEPEFFGDGPKGTILTITVESENPITASVTIGTAGSWNWNPPENLSPGVHKITISWKDITGITRKLTRNFVVQAGEAPAFEASGSGETTTATPTPTASSNAKPTSSPKVTASPAPIPQTGNLTPTILFSILGIGVMALSFVTYKHAQSI
ncbi:MAG: Ig-like domain-containing protein [Patescibacteria group bacterium]